MTESHSSASSRLDEPPLRPVPEPIDREDGRASEAVARALSAIDAAGELLIEGWRAGGRWIYAGAGSSGRIAALDASRGAG